MERVEEMFKTEPHRVLARQMVMAHPHAADYLRQCPLLLFAVGTSSRVMVPKHCHAIAKKRKDDIKVWTGQVTKGQKLRELMAAYHIPYQFRRIDVRAAGAQMLWVARVMFSFGERGIGFSETKLAAVIPVKPNHQAKLAAAATQYFHQALSTLTRVHADRDMDGLAKPLCRVKWLLVSISRHKGLASYPIREDEMAALADFVISRGGEFNEDWTLARAIRECGDWHDRLAARDENMSPEAFMVMHGYDWGGPLTDYAPFPERAEVDGFEFVALNSGEAIYGEGLAMRHCVIDYGMSVVRGTSRLFSVRVEGKSVGTLQLGSSPLAQVVFRSQHLFTIYQLRGYKNRRVALAVKKAANKFLELHGT